MNIKNIRRPGEVIIAPSILAANISKLAEEIRDVEAAGADWLHVDVMDGTFVPQITFGANVVAAAKKSCSLFLDVHLMIVNPELHLADFKQAGADRITVHQETCPHLHRTLQEIKSLGLSSGVCLNPATPAQSVFDVLDVCDLVLVMTVNPGWGGQAFIPSCLPKIEQLKAEIARRNCCVHLQVDGGINPDTALRCKQAGADVLVAGSYVFSAKDRGKAISSLRV